MLQKNDPANYRNLSAPFESKEKANESIEKFYEELQELRNKYKMRDVLVVIQGAIIYADGEEGDFIVHGFFGNSINQAYLAAYVYGKVKADTEEVFNKLSKG